MFRDFRCSLKNVIQNLGSILFFDIARPGFQFWLLCVEAYQHLVLLIPFVPDAPFL